MEVFKDFETACEEVLKVEEEFIAILKEKMPEYVNNSIPKDDEEDVSGGGGLGTISEANEETEEFRFGPKYLGKE